MHHIRRTGFSNTNKWFSVLKSGNGLCSFMGYVPRKYVSDVDLAGFSSTTAQRIAINDFAKGDVLRAAGIPVLLRVRRIRESVMSFQSPFQLTEIHGTSIMGPFFARSFAPKASQSGRGREILIVKQKTSSLHFGSGKYTALSRAGSPSTSTSRASSPSTGASRAGSLSTGAFRAHLELAPQALAPPELIQS
ncbi:hypothetical protein F0562_007191 [Nyssa sinensis]|uniref:Uncharacterized protein n=1 Tax=Nyssa sinensis TaxID=561372 RepID=A0A5J5A7I1_9ASTE|nr:hypothetical protein F0562_007191 [Nyssa sinensis]